MWEHENLFGAKWPFRCWTKSDKLLREEMYSTHVKQFVAICISIVSGFTKIHRFVEFVSALATFSCTYCWCHFVCDFAAKTASDLVKEMEEKKMVLNRKVCLQHWASAVSLIAVKFGTIVFPLNYPSIDGVQWWYVITARSCCPCCEMGKYKFLYWIELN